MPRSFVDDSPWLGMPYIEESEVTVVSSPPVESPWTAETQQRKARELERPNTHQTLNKVQISTRGSSSSSRVSDAEIDMQQALWNNWKSTTQGSAAHEDTLRSTPQDDDVKSTARTRAPPNARVRRNRKPQEASETSSRSSLSRSLANVFFDVDSTVTAHRKRKGKRSGGEAEQGHSYRRPKATITKVKPSRHQLATLDRQGEPDFDGLQIVEQWREDRDDRADGLYMMHGALQPEAERTPCNAYSDTSREPFRDAGDARSRRSSVHFAAELKTQLYVPEDPVLHDYGNADWKVARPGVDANQCMPLTAQNLSHIGDTWSEASSSSSERASADGKNVSPLSHTSTVGGREAWVTDTNNIVVGEWEPHHHLLDQDPIDGWQTRPRSFASSSVVSYARSGTPRASRRSEHSSSSTGEQKSMQLPEMESRTSAAGTRSPPLCGSPSSVDFRHLGPQSSSHPSRIQDDDFHADMTSWDLSSDDRPMSPTTNHASSRHSHVDPNTGRKQAVPAGTRARSRSTSILSRRYDRTTSHQPSDRRTRTDKSSSSLHGSHISSRTSRTRRRAPPYALGPFASPQTNNPDIWSPIEAPEAGDHWRPMESTIHPFESVSNASYQGSEVGSGSSRTSRRSRHGW